MSLVARTVCVALILCGAGCANLPNEEISAELRIMKLEIVFIQQWIVATGEVPKREQFVWYDGPVTQFE
jgi:hypothetical protein